MENKYGVVYFIPKESILLLNKIELVSCITKMNEIMRYLKYIKRSMKAKGMDSK